MGVYANLRPAIVYDELLNASTLKPEVIKGCDIMVVMSLLVVSILENQELMMDLKHLIQWFIQNQRLLELEKLLLNLQ